MSNNVERIVWKGWFSVGLPKGWAYTQENSMISFYREDGGVGALHVSFAKRTKEQRPNVQEVLELALSFANEHQWEVETNKIKSLVIDNCLAAEFDYQDDDYYWQVWHIIEESRLAFITYTCTSNDVDIELRERNELLGSFRWE